ncbi:hypothetical protein JTB14_006407 [Gonioctena quinquepunctata]|nr:hypothetical protein JTB14_006407 [Gonioctena quinquepunctata]
MENYFFFLGNATFFALGEDAPDETAALAVFGFGAFGFFVGPLIYFLAFDGDFLLLAEIEDEALVVTDFLSSPVALLVLAAVDFSLLG